MLNWPHAVLSMCSTPRLSSNVASSPDFKSSEEFAISDSPRKINYFPSIFVRFISKKKRHRKKEGTFFFLLQFEFHAISFKWRLLRRSFLRNFKVISTARQLLLPRTCAYFHCCCFHHFNCCAIQTRLESLPATLVCLSPGQMAGGKCAYRQFRRVNWKTFCRLIFWFWSC